MGQRTAIILQHVNKYAAKWNKKNVVNTRVFYCQWGIGRILPSQLVAILNGTLSANIYSSDAVEVLKPQGTTDITNLDNYRKSDLALLDKLDFENPEHVGCIISNACNNNGGIFVRLTTDEGGDLSGVEYAYMLGSEEGGDYKSFCTEEEWMAKAGYKYIDKAFRKIYGATLKYFGAKEYKPKKKCKKMEQTEEDAIPAF